MQTPDFIAALVHITNDQVAAKFPLMQTDLPKIL